MRRRRSPDGDGGLRDQLAARLRARIRPSWPTEPTGDQRGDILFGARRYYERRIEQLEAGNTVEAYGWELPAEHRPAGSPNRRVIVDTVGRVARL